MNKHYPGFGSHKLTSRVPKEGQSPTHKSSNTYFHGSLYFHPVDNTGSTQNTGPERTQPYLCLHNISFSFPHVIQISR